ncbi:hypothetical protein GCM10017673_28230 [Streptosporangium violaceochromogenes]|nr:hypothetical protein GCM10017673_28230 [Streptosporangium violaceochromogenes]
MDTIGQLSHGLAVALTPENILWAFLGALVGTLIGVLPGLGPTAGMALLVPLSVGLEPASAVIMIAAIYYGAMYGGSTTAILMNVPGEVSSVVTALDGYAMARQGRGGAALAIAAIGSFAAGLVSILLLVVLAPLIAPLALSFGPLELCALTVLALVAAVNLAGRSPARGLLSCGLGLLIAMVGSDPVTGEGRFTFGSVELLAGIGFIPVVVGLFAISEILVAAESGAASIYEGRLARLYPSRDELRRSVGPIARGSLLGFVLGLIPGLSPAAASFTAYDVERRISRSPERFGKGAIEGVASPEAANNSAVGGGLVPLLTLGIPTSPTIAVLLGAFLVHGVTPGPLIFSEHPDVAWPFIASMFVGNVILVLLNLPLVRIWARIVSVPYAVILPVILLVSFIGVYSVNSRGFDVVVMLVFGFCGYGMRRARVPLAPMVLALVIAPIIESSFRQSLSLGGGSVLVFGRSPLALGLLGVALILLWTGLRSRRRAAVAAAVEEDF